MLKKPKKKPAEIVEAKEPEEPVKEAPLNDAQSAIYKALDEYGFSVSFPDDTTYRAEKHGKIDTGNINQPLNVIVAAARRL